MDDDNYNNIAIDTLIFGSDLMIPWKFTTIANREFHNHYFCLVLYKHFFQEHMNKLPRDYYLKAQMTGQHVRQSKDLPSR